eukprot:1158556-Pelagomonas_calceolata.AAC.5
MPQRSLSGGSQTGAGAVTVAPTSCCPCCNGAVCQTLPSLTYFHYWCAPSGLPCPGALGALHGLCQHAAGQRSCGYLCLKAACAVRCRCPEKQGPPQRAGPVQTRRPRLRPGCCF